MAKICPMVLNNDCFIDIDVVPTIFRLKLSDSLLTGVALNLKAN